MTGSAKDEIAWYAKALEDGAKGERCQNVPAKYHSAYRDGFEEGEVDGILKRPDGFTAAVEHICKRHGDGEIESDRAMALINIAIQNRGDSTFFSIVRRYRLLEEAAGSTDPVEGFRRLRALSDWCQPRRAVLSIIDELLGLRGEMASSGGRGSRSPDPEGS